MSKACRLFEQFRPEHYELYLEPDRESMTFRGVVTVTGQKTGRPSQRITLHQKDLKVLSAEVTKHDKRGDLAIEISRINLQKSFDEVRLHSAAMIYPGKYTIKLEFSGQITETMQGIYPCYFEHDGKKKKLIATQFESHHAREAFPCIDEPEAKATFQLSIVTPKDEVVLSNTPIVKEVASSKQQVASKKLQTNNYKLTTFEKTPRMSAYLLAFVFGEMHAAEAKSKSGVAVKSWASVAQPQDSLEYSAQEAARILDYFADYFGVPYPLPKLDQVALPDFDAGAMENWGLVTYREIALLTNPRNRSISTEQYVTLVVAHELSHQWFGNLVTMKWWDDLWLNESFAGLMEHVASDALHPDWQQWELYAAGDIPLITGRDVYKDIQPVGVKVVDPELIETLFDPAIVYAKGARLIKMLREYIGDDKFVAGINAYFKKHAYGNATRDDLWEALSAASGKDIKALMTPWLSQPGMPVVHVSQKGKKLNLNQERFLLDDKPDGSIWPIPLLSDHKIEPDVLDKKSVELQLNSNDFVLLNQQASGQFITHYTEAEHVNFLTGKLELGQMAAETRINLLNDMYVLARHGDASLTDALKTVSKCVNEPRDSVWALVFRTVGAAQQLTEGDEQTEDQIKKFRVSLAKNWHAKLGWNDAAKDDANTKQLRHSMISLMVSGEDPALLKEALDRYKKAKNLEDIGAEIRGTILAAAVKHKTSGAVEKLMKAYSKANAEVQMDICAALSATREPEVVREVLQAALGENGFVRPQDVMRWVALFLRNYYIREVTWDYLEANWPWFEKTFEKSKSFDYLPTYMAGVISTPDGLKRYQKFFESKKHIKPLQHNVALGIADINARVAWRQRDEDRIKNFFAAQ